MKSKIEKYLKYVAAAVFVATLAINTVVTLDDPFVMISKNAIATVTDSISVDSISSPITLPGQTCIGTLCNNLVPVITDVYKHKLTGEIKAASVDLGFWWDNIGYDYICNAALQVQWCDTAKQGRTLYSHE